MDISILMTKLDAIESHMISQADLIRDMAAWIDQMESDVYPVSGCRVACKLLERAKTLTGYTR